MSKSQAGKTPKAPTPPPKQGWVSEFIAFIEQRNVVDLAVAVVIGAAFGQIVNSLVNNIIMPLVGVLLGGRDISGLEFTVGEAVVTYGVFLQNVINFLIIAFSIFWFAKFMKRAGAFSKTAACHLTKTPPST
ncbi:large conductance mechanosensitive channel protein MscL [Candidatus Saccharibacteria bacterium]|nr:large conductance mechanosensitive channel protein MscL [Candidatus Saccharibacteria bacterium]